MFSREKIVGFKSEKIANKLVQIAQRPGIRTAHGLEIPGIDIRTAHTFLVEVKDEITAADDSVTPVIPGKGVCYLLNRSLFNAEHPIDYYYIGPGGVLASSGDKVEVLCFNLTATAYVAPARFLAVVDNDGDLWIVAAGRSATKAMAILVGDMCGGTITSSDSSESSGSESTSEGSDSSESSSGDLCEYGRFEPVTFRCFKTTDVVSSLSVTVGDNRYRHSGQDGDLLELSYDANTNTWYVSDVTKKEKTVITHHYDAEDNCIYVRYELVNVETCTTEYTDETFLCWLICPEDESSEGSV